jgi:protein JSN1
MTLAEPRPPSTYYMSIPVIQERAVRRFDSTRLKDLRKRLDSGVCEQEEIDAITLDLMEDCAEVS